jgi:hypothetical protein
MSCRIQTNTQHRAPNAPKWAKYAVVYTEERARVTGSSPVTKYFADIGKALSLAEEIDEDVLPIAGRVTPPAVAAAARIHAVRAALRAKYGAGKHRITGTHATEEVHVYSTMPNSNQTGWWLMGSLAQAEDWLGIDRA